MVDDSDVDFAILAWPDGGWICGLIGLAVVVLLACAVSRNHDECSKKHCDVGQPRLLDHACLCVEPAQ